MKKPTPKPAPRVSETQVRQALTRQCEHAVGRPMNAEEKAAHVAQRLRELKSQPARVVQQEVNALLKAYGTPPQHRNIFGQPVKRGR